MIPHAEADCELLVHNGGSRASRHEKKYQLQLQNFLQFEAVRFDGELIASSNRLADLQDARNESAGSNAQLSSQVESELVAKESSSAYDDSRTPAAHLALIAASPAVLVKRTPIGFSSCNPVPETPFEGPRSVLQPTSFNTRGSSGVSGSFSELPSVIPDSLKPARITKLPRNQDTQRSLLLPKRRKMSDSDSSTEYPVPPLRRNFFVPPALNQNGVSRGRSEYGNAGTQIGQDAMQAWTEEPLPMEFTPRAPLVTSRAASKTQKTPQKHARSGFANLPQTYGTAKASPPTRPPQSTQEDFESAAREFAISIDDPATAEKGDVGEASSPIDLTGDDQVSARGSGQKTGASSASLRGRVTNYRQTPTRRSRALPPLKEDASTPLQAQQTTELSGEVVDLPGQSTDLTRIKPSIQALNIVILDDLPPSSDQIVGEDDGVDHVRVAEHPVAAEGFLSQQNIQSTIPESAHPMAQNAIAASKWPAGDNWWIPAKHVKGAGAFKTHITTRLEELSAYKILDGDKPIQDLYPGQTTGSPPKIHERGCWTFRFPSITSGLSWSPEERDAFWDCIDKWVKGGDLGLVSAEQLNSWAMRNPTFGYKDNELAWFHSDMEDDWARLFCFGETVKEIWCALWLASSGRITKLPDGMRWVTGTEECRIVCPGTSSNE